MSMWIIKQNGEILSRKTLRILNDSDFYSETEKTNKDIFTKAVNKNIGPTLYEIGINSDLGNFFDDTDMPSFTPYRDNESIEDPTMPEADAITDYDRYIESKVILPSYGKEMSSATVVSRVKDKDGKLKGNHNKNPILDTKVYDVMFPDGAVCRYAANIIAENMYSQVDSNCHNTLLLKKNTDHMKSAMAVPIYDKFLVSKTVRKSLRKTNKG